MSDKSAHPEEGRRPVSKDLSFTPVLRLCDRSNGWKPEVQRAFIEALAETGSVRAACRRVGRSEHGAYQLRRHPEGESLRAAWDAALDLGVRRIEDAAPDPIRGCGSVSLPIGGTARSTAPRRPSTTTASTSPPAAATTSGW